MAFSTAEEFVARSDLSLDDVDLLNREQLYSVAQSLELRVFSGAKKGFLSRLVIQGLKENGLLEDSDGTSGISESSEVEVLTMQLKIEEVERESEKERRELREREMEHEREIKRMELESQARASPTISRSNFDFAKNIRMVPRFEERDVAQYFSSFESLASNLEWSKEHWPTLLHSVFVQWVRPRMSTPLCHVNKVVIMMW